jgi:hypothetical protein
LAQAQTALDDAGQDLEQIHDWVTDLPPACTANKISVLDEHLHERINRGPRRR